MKTLTEVVAELQKNRASVPPKELPIKDIETKEPAGTMLLPAYVFRGEANAAWDATVSSMERLRINQDLTEEEKQSIYTLRDNMDTRLQSWLGLSPGESAGILQHYCLPTELIDVSPDLAVAAFFAAYANVSNTGSIMVMNTEVLNQNAVVMDLTGITGAIRPKSQTGYGVFHRKMINLRMAGAFPPGALERVTFTVSDEEIESFSTNTELLREYEDWSDPGRAIICNLIDSYTKNITRLPPKAATWLASRVPATPYIITDCENEGRNAVLTVGIPPRDFPFDPDAEPLFNERRWAMK